MNKLYVLKSPMLFIAAFILMTAYGGSVFAQSFTPKPQTPMKRLKVASDLQQTIALRNLFGFPTGVAETGVDVTAVAAITVTSDNPGIIQANGTTFVGGTWVSYIVKGGNLTGTATLTISIDYNGVVTSNTIQFEVAHVVVNNESAAVVPGGFILIDVLANDQPSASINPSTLEITTQPTAGTATIVEDQSKKKIRYESNAGTSNWTADNVEYRVADNAGNYSSSAKVTIAVNLSSYATKFFEYKPAPGQFINKTPWGLPSIAATNVLGAPNGSGVSLGGFGGYVVVGFDQPITNNPRNRYGVDFTVSGNAFASWTEPASVMVMKDVNGNGLPDDTWYELAGSEYHFSPAKKINMTYVNPRYSVGKDVFWETNLGDAGVLRDNTFHNQPYYPQPDVFSNIDGDRQAYNGTQIKIRVNRSNPSSITSGPFTFGYADNKSNNTTPTIPRNPYFADANGASADGFDLAWAVDENGNSVSLDEVHFVKIYNSAQEDAGWLGEASSEIDGVSITTPDPSWVSQDYYVQLIASAPFQILKGASHTFEGLLFKNGIPQTVPATWNVSDPSIGSIDAQGKFTAIANGAVTIQYSADANLPLATFDINVVELADMVLSTNSATIVVNQQAYVHAEGIDNRVGANRFIYDTYTFTVSDEALASVTNNGIVTGKAAGVVTVTATSNTNASITKSTQITIGEAPAIVMAPGTDKLNYAQGVTTERIDLNTVFSTTGGGQIFNVFVKSSNEDLVTTHVDGFRFLTLAFFEGAAGTAEITVAATAYGKTEEFEFTVTVTPELTVKDKKIVFVNGGQFGSTAGNVQIVDPVTFEVEKLADFDRAQSVQDVVAEGRYVYVSAEYDIIKYDLVTNQEVARRFTQDKSPETADGASEDGKGINHTITLYKDYLIATRQHSYAAPEDGYNVRIYNKNDLSLVKKIAVSTQAAGVIAVGDSAFVALNGGFQGGTGQLAIIDLINLEKKEEFDFGEDGKSIMQLFSKDKHLYILAENKMLDYSIKNRTYTRHDVGVGHADFSSSPLATTILDNKLYGKTIWDDGMSKGYGSFDLATHTISENDVLGISTDEDVINNGYMLMASAYDREDERFYITYGTWWGDGAGYVYSKAGEKLGNFGNVQTSPERLAISYGMNNHSPYNQNQVEDIALMENESFEVNLNDYFNDDDHEDLSFIARTASYGPLPAWITLSGGVLRAAAAPKDETLSFTITLTAMDESGESVNQEITVTVTPIDSAPFVVNDIADVTVEEDAADYGIDISGVFGDEDNEVSAMVYSISQNTNTALVGTSLNATNLTLSFTPGHVGEADVTLQAESNGKTVETSFHVTVTVVTGIDGEVMRVTAYPNPVTDELRINVGSEQPNTTLTLINSAGQPLEQRIVRASEEIVNMRSVPAGVYILTVKTQRGEIKRKIIKK
jgi:hypothetical protein